MGERTNQVLGLFLTIILIAFLVWRFGIWGIIAFVFLGVWLKIILGMIAIKKNKKRKK
jgi:O-antigen/teichoic acid export membrane protein